MDVTNPYGDLFARVGVSLENELMKLNEVVRVHGIRMKYRVGEEQAEWFIPGDIEFDEHNIRK